MGTHSRDTIHQTIHHQTPLCLILTTVERTTKETTIRPTKISPTNTAIPMDLNTTTMARATLPTKAQGATLLPSMIIIKEQAQPRRTQQLKRTKAKEDEQIRI